MTGNYFVVERNGKCIEHLSFVKDDGMIAFEDVLNMSYDKIKQYEHIEEFVVATMDATNQYFNENDAETLITLVGEDDVFIWSILIGSEEGSNNIRYVFINWLADDKRYCYEKS